MGNIPGIKSPRFYEKKWVVEVIAVVPPIVAGSVTAWQNIIDPDKETLGWILAACIAWLIVASIVKVLNAQSQDKEQKQKHTHDGLRGALSVLYGSISSHLNFKQDELNTGKLRVTIHRVVPPDEADRPSEFLEQLIPYIGGKGGRIGRRFSIRSGIIGRAVREQAPFAFTRHNDDYEAFIRELVANWSYTEADARTLTSDRFSWMAVPIFGPNYIVLAVVYLDSSERALFTKPVQRLVISACHGIAIFIDERYK